jgi:hypothetical protein
MRRKHLVDQIRRLASKKHRTKKTTRTPEEETVDMEGKDVKDGQEGTA